MTESFNCLPKYENIVEIMNTTKKLLTFFLSMLLFGSVISTVNATITKEYTKDSYDVWGQMRFTYKVKINIETEADEVWIGGRTYLVSFTVTLTYLNQSMFPAFGFYIVFHSLGDIYGVEKREIVTNSTTVSLGQSGTVSVLATVPTTQTRVKIEPSLAYTLYVKNQFFEHGYWSSKEPIYIDVKSPSPPSPPFLLSPELYMAIGIILGVVLSGAFFIAKKRKIKG